MIWYRDVFLSALDQVPDGVTHAFGLVLNMMRDNTENRILVCVADRREEIESLLASERVERYADIGPSGFTGRDVTFSKCFRKGGPLEWYNPPEGIYSSPGIVELRRDGWRQVD